MKYDTTASTIDAATRAIQLSLGIAAWGTPEAVNYAYDHPLRRNVWHILSGYWHDAIATGPLYSWKP